MDQIALYEKIQEKLSKNVCMLLDKEIMTASDLDMLGKSVDIFKDISTIMAMDKYDYKDGETPRNGGQMINAMEHKTM